MTTKATEHRRLVVSWCPDCKEAVSTAEWADRHTAETGHPTHRRTSTVEVIERQDDT